MLLRKVLYSGSTSLLFYQITLMLTPWAITIYISWNEGLESVGTFSYYLSIITPLIMLISIPHRNLMISQNFFSLRSYINLRVMFYIFFFLVFVLTALVSGIELTPLLLAVYFYKVAELLCDVTVVKLIRKKNWGVLFRLGFLKACTAILILFIGWKYLNSATLIFVLGLLSLILLFTFSNMKENGTGYVALKTKELIKSSIPMSITALISSIQINVPRYVMGGNSYLTDLAVYTIFSYAGLVMIVIANSISQVCLRELTVSVKAGELMKVKKIILHTALKIFSVCCLIFFVFVTPLGNYLLVIFDLPLNDFHKDLLLISVLAAIPQVFQSAANYLLIACDEYKKMTYISFAGSIVTLLGCYHLFQYYELLGIYITLSSVGALHVIFVWFIFTRKLRLSNV